MEHSYNASFLGSKINAFCSHTKMETMNCSCGEEEKDFAWVWSTKEEDGQAGSIVLDPQCRLISFNPEYSSGTAAVRGNRILPTGYHHYWELKMTSAVYGTNIMVGVCTTKCDMKHGIHRFCSLLGRDEESWGYSYTGTVQHAAKFRQYGSKWGKGSLIGIHLDTWRGTLEFFLNREPLGIAFTGLQNKELYPIVTSTSAHSGMKLVSSYMFPHSLQFLSSEAVFKKFCKKADINPEDLSLPPGLRSYIQNNYWPFIKFVSLKSDDHRLEHIRVRNSKRPREEDSANLNRFKRYITHQLYNTTSPHTHQYEMKSDSSQSESSSSVGDSASSSHQCFPELSLHDSVYSGRESPPAHRCFKVLFDPTNSSVQTPHISSSDVFVRSSSLDNSTSDVSPRSSLDNSTSDVSARSSVHNSASDVSARSSVHNSASDVSARSSLDNSTSDVSARSSLDNSTSDVSARSSLDNSALDVSAKSPVDNAASDVSARSSLDNSLDVSARSSLLDNSTSSLDNSTPDQMDNASTVSANSCSKTHSIELSTNKD